MRTRRKKNTITTVGEVWSDIDHRFVKDAVGALKKAVNIEAVYTSIDNILRTMKGERVMLPEFASELHGMMFEPLTQTAVNFITRGIKESIEQWDDRVAVNEVTISRDPDRNIISIGLVFMVAGYSETFKYEQPIQGKIQEPQENL